MSESLIPENCLRCGGARIEKRVCVGCQTRYGNDDRHDHPKRVYILKLPRRKKQWKTVFRAGQDVRSAEG